MITESLEDPVGPSRVCSVVVARLQLTKEAVFLGCVKSTFHVGRIYKEQHKQEPIAGKKPSKPHVSAGATNVALLRLLIAASSNLTSLSSLLVDAQQRCANTFVAELQGGLPFLLQALAL